ncbi:class I SAM-dependent methyltransferase [Candidatus Mycolicibacterium alkanivorans]|uniref:Class I SAM-dependent methyltransferase n=1 Tax=Candidatus Mycolicibacterium alkanivorans TaxID=2954114 RepID=A0ABS9YTR3_9MYCO|nr:class I SAM-dependent methyltransferase [Candidatus Mycolicibacterium alkanivorans]MCI4674606.1 class I SAM-dependent methyltransferase [Candidatus Mycolicibacterium alkanivorans]
MSSKRLLFNAMYRLGITPWDEHPLAPRLLELIEGDAALPPGTALDIGCGTGDSSIYLARHGWKVTGVDFVPRALDKARAKAAAKRAAVDFAHADATRLRADGVGTDFGLIVDNGCLHGMSDDDRDAYVREVTAVAAPGARLLIVAVTPGSFPVRGIAQADVEQRFGRDWELLSTGHDQGLSVNDRFDARSYLFARRS